MPSEYIAYRENEMRLEVYDPQSGALLGRASTEERLNSLLEKQRHLSSVSLHLDLNIPLDANVMRVEGEPETVILESGGIERWVERSVGNDEDPEKLGVSCNPISDVASVDTINLSFRSIEDKATDRGIVWIRPGLRATASLVLKPANLGDESAFDIALAASKAVREKVVDRFVNH